MFCMSWIYFIPMCNGKSHSSSVRHSDKPRNRKFLSMSGHVQWPLKGRTCVKVVISVLSHIIGLGTKTSFKWKETL